MVKILINSPLVEALVSDTLCANLFMCIQGAFLAYGISWRVNCQTSCRINCQSKDMLLKFISSRLWKIKGLISEENLKMIEIYFQKLAFSAETQIYVFNLKKLSAMRHISNAIVAWISQINLFVWRRILKRHFKHHLITVNTATVNFLVKFLSPEVNIYRTDFK